MARKVRNDFLYLFFCLFLCAYLSHHYLHRDLPVSVLPTIVYDHQPPVTTTTTYNLQAVRENFTTHNIPPDQTAVGVHSPYPHTVSILLPDWEVLVIVSAHDTARLNNDGYHCLFPNNYVSPAKPSGLLTFPYRETFKCVLPVRLRRRMPFPNPILIKDPAHPPEFSSRPAPSDMLRWSYIVYDSLTTEEDDVVVLVKGLNNRQGSNRDPSEFYCVFYLGDDVANGVRTAVTNSMQEVFRCKRPETKAFPAVKGGEEIHVKVTLETVQDKKAVPSVAYFDPAVHKLAQESENDKKSLICACTMVFNVAKFLKEWVMYHAKLGVETFVLYDNGSDDDLHAVVGELLREGYDVRTYFWLWPKTQEAGFSHSAVYLKSSCTWTAYLDVDEFIYSPAWSNDTTASNNSILHSLLFAEEDQDREDGLRLGSIHIDCREFGPSNQTEHPFGGVTQGYNCRKIRENRHKSIVLLEAVEKSLMNVIHHFYLKSGFYGRKMSLRTLTVNHYKFQAWTEFKAKFRRRVSAYVVDWTRQVNPNSNDRAPGLGFEAVEPEGWANKFCEVRDDGLKELTQNWFAVESPSGQKMAWQS